MADIRGAFVWGLLVAVVLVPLALFWQSRGRVYRRSYQPPVANRPFLPAHVSPASSGASLPNPSAPMTPSLGPLEAVVAQKSGSARVGDRGSAPAPAADGASGGDSADIDPILRELPGYAPQVDRDPTMSPIDLERLADLKRPKPKIVARQIDIAERIQLYGIIVARGNFNAIVNDERVRRDDEVLGARIVRITANCVEFSYRKRRFEKCIQQ